MFLKLGRKSYLRGRWAEETALGYLLDKNLRLLEKNFRSAFGEIDLIMQDKNIICFIEVRYRESDYFHAPLESINKIKCDRIVLTSHQYLTKNRHTAHLDCRFDVVILSGKQQHPIIEWMKDAFQT